ncbi:MAG: carbohydrate kinase family protein [Kiritimatiellae bacterium]|nr:carbohydrate kinase family protein [Kiritimatiellia bacterium]
MASPSIVIAGSVLVDKLYEIAEYPNAGELTQIRSISRAPGGCVPNVAIDLKRFAPELNVCAAGNVGQDEDGGFAVAAMARNGVDVKQVHFAPDRTSFTDVMSVPGRERTFFTYPGASAGWGYYDFDFDRVREGDMVHLGYFLLLAKVDAGDGLKILKELKRRGAVTSIDLVTENSDRYALVRECLPFVDNLIVNEIEAERLSGVAPGTDLRVTCEALRAGGVKDRVVVHLPQKGVCLSPRGWCEMPSVKLPPSAIKGKTGAGDAFCAGALAGIARGQADEEILDLGAVAAVGAMRAPGATDGVQTEKELREYVGQFE